jgi:hypothetical protein
MIDVRINESFTNFFKKPNITKMKKILIIGLALFAMAMSACKKDASTEIKPQQPAGATPVNQLADSKVDHYITACVWISNNKKDTLKVSVGVNRHNKVSVTDTLSVKYQYHGKDTLPAGTIIAFAFMNTSSTIPFVLYPSANVPQGMSFAANDEPFPTFKFDGKKDGSQRLAINSLDVASIPANWYGSKTSFVQAYLRIEVPPPGEDLNLPFGHDTSDSETFYLTH